MYTFWVSSPYAYRTIGIDPGTDKIGMSDIAIIDNKICVINTFQEKLKGKTKELRLWHLYNFIESYLAGVCLDSLKGSVYESINDITTEATFLARGKKKISADAPLSLSMARGVIYAIAGKYNKNVVEYDHATHKKTLTGDGSAKKPQIIRAVQIKLGKIVQEDEAMAVSLGYCRLLNYYQEIHAKK